MHRSLAGLCVSCVLCVGVVQADPTSFMGSLTFAGGGVTGISDNPWLAAGTAFHWHVTNNQDGTFTYTYLLEVSGKAISHLTIEVSPSFSANDIVQVLQGALADDQPEDYPKAGDPGMPGPMRGVKFETGDGSDYAWTVSFVSTRGPTWGDFYAKNGVSGGTAVAIWNTGFTDPDPPASVADGSVGFHVLVPDTSTAVPIPGAILLGVLGAGMVGWLRRRRTV